MKSETTRTNMYRLGEEAIERGDYDNATRWLTRAWSRNDGVERSFAGLRRSRLVHLLKQLAAVHRPAAERLSAMRRQCEGLATQCCNDVCSLEATEDYLLLNYILGETELSHDVCTRYKDNHLVMNHLRKTRPYLYSLLKHDGDLGALLNVSVILSMFDEQHIDNYVNGLMPGYVLCLQAGSYDKASAITDCFAEMNRWDIVLRFVEAAHRAGECHPQYQELIAQMMDAGIANASVLSRNRQIAVEKGWHV